MWRADRHCTILWIQLYKVNDNNELLVIRHGTREKDTNMQVGWPVPISKIILKIPWNLLKVVQFIALIIIPFTSVEVRIISLKITKITLHTLAGAGGSEYQLVYWWLRKIWTQPNCSIFENIYPTITMYANPTLMWPPSTVLIHNYK